MPPDSKERFLGIEIGGTKLQFVTGDASGTPIQSIRYVIQPANGAAGIQSYIREGLQKLELPNPLAAIGVGFGGPVDWKTGTIHLSHQVEGWAHFNLKNWLESLTGTPVAIDNDANVAALAEAVYGCGKGYSNIFYMTIGSGIGGGMVLNRAIYHGAMPGEVEIGHICLDKNGTTLEAACSGWAVNKKVRAFIQNHPQSMLAQLAAGKAVPEATLLKPALEKGDSAAIQIIEDVADTISFALSHVVHLFHPEVIILGGGLSLLNKYLHLPVARQLLKYVMKSFLPPPPVMIASLGESVVPVGALELAKSTVHNKIENKNV